jgi:hypothetical protein
VRVGGRLLDGAGEARVLEGSLRIAEPVLTELGEGEVEARGSHRAG